MPKRVWRVDPCLKRIRTFWPMSKNFDGGFDLSLKRRLRMILSMLQEIFKEVLTHSQKVYRDFDPYLKKVGG